MFPQHVEGDFYRKRNSGCFLGKSELRFTLGKGTNNMQATSPMEKVKTE